jgi:phosphoenolpyruvate-protein phosphotransferase (PTS system enzyme I)
MEIINGNVISPGIAFGKAYVLQDEEIACCANLTPALEKENLNKAIEVATEKIELQISKANKQYDYQISEIFEAQKLIVNDPVLIENTIQYIDSGLNSIEAYQKAAHDFIKIIESSDNEYMLGRIIDIIDATEGVIKKLGNDQTKRIYRFDEPTILIVKDVKPSTIFSSFESNVCGYISGKGYFHQHSGIIGRKIKIPEIIIKDILSIIKGGESILIDGDDGKVYINPKKEIVSNIMKGAN